VQRKSNLVSNLDWGTIVLYVILVLMGWMNIYAAVYSEEHNSILDFSQRYGKQLIWITFAFFLGVVVLLSNGRIYSVFAYIIYGLVILLLLSTLVFGRVVNASKSWIPLGSFGIQPAEFAKFATALALARLMSPYEFKLNTFWSYVKVGLIIAIPAGIILLQNDTGTALVFGSFVLVLYREGLPWWVLGVLFLLVALFISTLVFSTPVIIVALYVTTVLIYMLQRGKFKFAISLTAGLTGLGFLLYLASQTFNIQVKTDYFYIIPVGMGIVIATLYAFFSRTKMIYGLVLFLCVTVGFSLSTEYVFENVLDVHHQKRINDLLGIESDPLGWGYNVNQSKIAIGSGGFWGKGYLSGTQTKFNFVPEQSTDFIFCTVGEEWGFVGSLVVLALFAWLLLRLIRIAERQRESFSRIYGYGVVSILFFHIAVNIWMAVGLLPVIGIPLPFFSYGGSSLWAFTILVFILLRLDADRYGTFKG